MEDFTIYCTQEQTLKAWELGANLHPLGVDHVDHLFTNYVIEVEGKCYMIPTAEQMLGWLMAADKVWIDFSRMIRNADKVKETGCRKKFRYKWYIETYDGFTASGKVGTYKDAVLTAISQALNAIEKGW